MNSVSSSGLTQLGIRCMKRTAHDRVMTTKILLRKWNKHRSVCVCVCSGDWREAKEKKSVRRWKRTRFLRNSQLLEGNGENDEKKVAECPKRRNVFNLIKIFLWLHGHRAAGWFSCKCAIAEKSYKIYVRWNDMTTASVISSTTTYSVCRIRSRVINDVRNQVKWWTPCASARARARGDSMFNGIEFNFQTRATTDRGTAESCLDLYRLVSVETKAKKKKNSQYGSA